MPTSCLSLPHAQKPTVRTHDAGSHSRGTTYYVTVFSTPQGCSSTALHRYNSASDALHHLSLFIILARSTSLCTFIPHHNTTLNLYILYILFRIAVVPFSSCTQTNRHLLSTRPINNTLRDQTRCSNRPILPKGRQAFSQKVHMDLDSMDTTSRCQRAYRHHLSTRRCGLANTPL